MGNLRPTFEPILWFVKPYVIGTTIADNVLAHDVGAFNERAFVSYEQTPEAHTAFRGGLFRTGQMA